VSFRNERMARGFRSLDRLADTIDLGKSRLVSDGGAGARQIRRAADGEETSPREDTRAARLADARRRLVESGLARLVPVLDQIVRNGKNRQESICNLAKTWHVKTPIARLRYYRGSSALLAFFSPNKFKGETRVDNSK
jgi:hypothetical protein